MKIFLALCLIGTVFASYPPKKPVFHKPGPYVEFDSKDFKVTEPKITYEEAKHLAYKQPSCAKYACHRDFKDFSKQVCKYRKYSYTQSGYGSKPGPDGYGDRSQDGYGDRSGPDGYAAPHADGYGKPIHKPKIYEKCYDDDCSWYVKEAFSKCFGKVQLYKQFSVCGSECGKTTGYGEGYNTYYSDCGSYESSYGARGYKKCSCQTIFCVKHIYTAFFEDYRKGYSAYDVHMDKKRTIRKGTLRYKFPCKCSCRSKASVYQ